MPEDGGAKRQAGRSATWIIIKINVNVINTEEVRSRSQRVATVVIGQLDKERILDDSTPFWLCKKASIGSLASPLLQDGAFNPLARSRPKPMPRRASPQWRRTFEGQVD